MIIKIVLPMPPSINVAYANGSRGRFKTKKYKEWEKLAGEVVSDKYTYHPEEGKALKARYTFYSKWINKGDGKIKRKDLSNYLKCLEDYLDNIITGFDDSYIWEYETMLKVHSDREEVEIELVEIDI